MDFAPSHHTPLFPPSPQSVWLNGSFGVAWTHRSEGEREKFLNEVVEGESTSFMLFSLKRITPKLLIIRFLS